MAKFLHCNGKAQASAFCAARESVPFLLCAVRFKPGMYGNPDAGCGRAFHAMPAFARDEHVVAAVQFDWRTGFKPQRGGALYKQHPFVRFLVIPLTWRGYLAAGQNSFDADACPAGRGLSDFLRPRLAWKFKDIAQNFWCTRGMHIF